jgi:DNA-binding FrmR family transcriptional regulator
MKEGFNGNLKDIILHMIENDTDCCEVTNTVEDVSVTVEVTIKKIVDGDTVVYDAAESDDSYDDEIYDYTRDKYLS